MRGKLLACIMLACGMSPACKGYQEPDFPDAPPRTVDEPREPDKPPQGALWRQDVLGVVDAGLGTFLQRVRVEAALEEGRFTGFRILELRPATFWSGVDLRPGDVITSVNGMPIERDTEAFAAFTGLRQASELRVELVRSGETRALVYRIVDRPAGAAGTEHASAGGSTTPAVE